MKIHIWEDYSRARIILVGEVNQCGTIQLVGFDGKDLVFQDYDPSSGVNPDIIPLLQFPMMDRNEILKSLLDALSNRNIKTENENLLQGKLIATEKHLEDMREISKNLIAKITNSKI
jgi:hypothetical protein